jgi:hypothetical protein
MTVFHMFESTLRTKLGLVAALVGALSTVPPRALAFQEPAPAPGVAAGDSIDREVDKLVLQGLELRKQKRDEEALETFRRAHSLRSSARTLGQMGLALQQLRRWAEAEQELVAALSAADSSWLREHREILEQQLEKVRRHVGDLIIIGTTGASVAVNGRPVGTLPLTKAVRASEGKAIVRARAEGFEPFSQEVVVQGGSSTSLEIALNPLRQGATPPLVDPPAIPSGPETTTAADHSAGNVRRWLAGGVFVLSAGALVSSAVLWSKDGEPSCARLPCPGFHNYTAGKWGLLAAGVAGGGFATWLWLSTPGGRVGVDVNQNSLTFLLRGTL